MGDQDLQKKLDMYKAMAAADPNIDVSKLMADALEADQENNLTSKEKIRAYMISLILPPFGLIYAIKFYFSGKSDGKKAALFCALLTIFTIFISTVLLNAILSAGNTNVQQLQQINPNQIQGLFQ